MSFGLCSTGSNKDDTILSGLGCKANVSSAVRIIHKAPTERSKFWPSPWFNIGNRNHRPVTLRHMRTVRTEIKRVMRLDEEELVAEAKNIGAPLSLVQQVAKLGKLPVPNFAAGGIATPADASLMMQLGAESVFVGSGIFKSDDPAARAKAVVEATTHYRDPKSVAKASSGLKKAMKGLDMTDIPKEERLQERGW